MASGRPAWVRNHVPRLRTSRKTGPTSARSSRARRGQSLVEFALVLPVVLMIVLVGLDFGRVFLGWVQLNSIAREAAAFASRNPDAWNTVNPQTKSQSQYANLITNEASGINCTMPGTLPKPVFQGGANGPNPIGSPAQVTISCKFTILTPVISNILGGQLPVTASAAFPVTAGMIAGIPIASSVPTTTTTTTTSTTTSSTTTSSTTTTSTTTTSTTTTPMCTVPNLVGVDVKQADNKWGVGGQGAGFTTPLGYSPLVGPNSKGNITAQSVTAGQSVPCNSSMTVTW
jgi:hypothetical protein